VTVLGDIRDVTDTATSTHRRWPVIALFMALTTAYAALGTVLTLRYNMFEWDSFSRVANAGYALLSRDPHLAAIGFVWNPLPSILEMPLLWLSNWCPLLKTAGLAGLPQSAAFTAGSALMVRQIAIDRGAGTVWRWAAVGCFALHPMNIVYGASGMSEAAMVFSLLWCTRYLLRWVDGQRVSDLAWAGIALGVGYLVRYEMIPAAAGATVLVAAVAYTRNRTETRTPTTLLNIAIVVFPTATAVILWASAGWIVNGDFFAIVSSQYGNASQIETALARGDITSEVSIFVIWERLLGMQPFLGLAVVLAAALAALERRVDVLVPMVTFGAVLAFTAWGHFSATTYGLSRYYMPAVPLVLVIALACWTPSTAPGTHAHLDSVARKCGAALLAGALLIGIPVSTLSMRNENNNGQLLLGVNSVLDPHRHPPDEQWYRRAGDDDRRVAKFLDNKNLPAGTVLTDTFAGAVVWLASDNPKQFVITSDYDFTVALNRPWAFGIRYILVSNPAGNAAQDAITERYPAMWADGAGIGDLVLIVDGPNGQPRWRVYQVQKPDGPAEPPP
jgi:hypothetical protein